MTTKTEEPREQRSLIPWRQRASYVPGKTRKQRQAQYRTQMNALMIAVLVAVVGGGLYAIINYQAAGSTKNVSCEEFPEYCVPPAGALADYPALEAPASRTLDVESEAAPGVVRAIDPTNHFAYLGNPDAPIHFVTVSDFACSHCQAFHMGDAERFMKDYVLTGQATFGIVLTTGTGLAYSQLATQAALCAGEQGAFWEMSSEFFRQGNSRGVTQAFTLTEIKKTAADMGLDADALVECVATGRYQNFLNKYQTFAADHAVTGTPTVLVSYGNSGTWSAVTRNYDNLKSLTEKANANQ